MEFRELSFRENNVPSLVIREKIDRHVLLKLKNEPSLGMIRAPDEFYEFMNNKPHVGPKKQKAQKNYTLRDVLRQYEKREWEKSFDYLEMDVVYTRTEANAATGFGRLYGAGAQNLKRELRDTLFHFCSNLDIENCFFVVLRAYVRGFKKEFPLLEEYVADRDMFLDTLGNLPDKKTLLISLLFGASLEKWKRDQGLVALDAKLLRFRDEMAQIRTFVMGCDNLLGVVPVETPLHELEVRNISLLLQTLESRILASLVRGCLDRGVIPRLLLHDGLEVEGRLEHSDALLAFLVRWVEKETGIRVVLKWKPKDKAINLDDVQEVVDNSYFGTKTRFEQTTFKVLAQNSYYSLIDGVYKIGDQKSLLSRWKHVQYVDEDEEKKTFIERWVGDESLRLYTNCGLYPDDTLCPPDHFNMFTGFAAEKVHFTEEELALPEVVEALVTMKNLLRRLVENDKHFEYILYWIAHLFQFPNVKPRVALVIKSEQGCGKGFFGSFLTDIIGLQYTFKTSNIDHIVGAFNAGIFNKLFVTLDDVGSLKIDAIEKFKSPISEPTATIRQMHMSPFETPDYVRYIMFTNSDRFLVLTEEERRFFMTSSHAKKLHAEDAQRILKAKSDVRVQYAFYREMMNVKIPDGSKFAFDERRPLSSLYARVKDYYQSLELQFFSDFILSNCFRVTPSYMGSREVKEFFQRMEVSCKSLTQFYSKWVEGNKYQHGCSSRDLAFRLESEFGGDFSKYDIQKLRCQRHGLDRQMWIFGDVEKILFFFSEKGVIEKTRYEEMCREWMKHRVQYTREIECNE
jgi:hypothetical protein